jgi:Ca2+-binding EF-hand superfamily protein
LNEGHFMNNLKYVFGFDCPYLSRMLYLHASNNMNKAKIPLSRLIVAFMALTGDRQKVGEYNKLVFKILDVDRDGQLNILNLRLISYYIQHNILSKSIFSRVEIVYDIYR